VFHPSGLKLPRRVSGKGGLEEEARAKVTGETGMKAPDGQWQGRGSCQPVAACACFLYRRKRLPQSKAMKLITLLLSVMLTAALHAETPDEILADYHGKASKACEKLNTTLRREGESVVKRLIQNGSAQDATQAAGQVEDKVNGKLVAMPHLELKQLFAQFDAARETTLAPIRKASLAKLDALLKNTTSASQGMKNLVRVAECKAEIEGGQIAASKTNEPAATTSSPSDHLRKNKIPKKWGYYLSKDFSKRYGTLTLDSDGTFVINAASPGSGTWTPTADPLVLALDIKNQAGVPEKTELRIEGDEATLKRVSGIRYLKAD